MTSARWQPSALMRASVGLHAMALAAVAALPQHWPWGLGVTLANHGLLTLLGLWPRSHALGPNWTQLPAAATARHEIALTIDDGPDPEVTPQVLDILERYAARATFFCIGDKAARHPELCREIVRRGHAVENHSQRHSHYFAFLGMGGLSREIQTAQATFSAITGRAPVFFRAPAGIRSPLLDPVLARLGLQLVAWTRRGFDTRIAQPGVVQRRLVRDVKAGAILLLHDGNCARSASGVPVIVAVLPALLAAATAAGLKPVTLVQALQADRA